MKIKWNLKRTIISLITIIFILLVIVTYVFIISPSIQNMKVDAHKQGVLDVIGYINNQIQVRDLSEINLGDKVILCQYDK